MNSEAWREAQWVSEQSGIPAEFVYRQWAHESGNFSSQLARENNNFGGLTQTTPNGEENRQPDGGNYYKQYGSMHEYAEDYLNSFIKYYDGIANVKSIDEFAQVLRDNGYYTDSVENYARGLKGIDVEGAIDYSVLEPKHKEGYNLFDKWDFERLARNQGRGKPIIPQQENPDIYPASIGEKLWAGASDGFQSTTMFGTGNIMWGNLVHSSSPFGQQFKVTEDDVKYVTTALAGDEDAQRFVLLNARDRDSMQWLTQQKIEERKRKEKLASYGAGWATVGSLAGGLIDPINLIPIGTGVNALRIMGRTAGTITNVAKIAKYAQIGAQVSFINTVDTGLRGAVHGYKPGVHDYAWSAGLGFVLGSLGSALGDTVMNFISRQTDSMRIASMVHTAEDDALKFAADLVPSNVAQETRGIVSKYHDAEYIKTSNNADLVKLAADEKIFVTSLKDAQVIAQRIGVKLPENAKALHVPNEGYSLFIKEKIKSPEHLEGLLKHEFAVHAGLRHTMGEKKYNKLMSQIASDMDKEGTMWNKARRLSGGYDPEEVLAYAVENGMIKKNVMRSMSDAVRKGLKREGINTKYSENDIADFIQQSMQAELERATGIHYNPDGSTTWGGVKYSKDNIVNPHVLAQFFDLEQDVEKLAQGGLAGKGAVGRLLSTPLQKIGKHAEATYPVANPYGVGINSLSPTYRKATSNLLSDPRQRGHGGEMTITADRQKEAIQQRLIALYTPYLDIRQQYILRNIKEGFGRKAHMEFDKQVFEAYNAKFAGNKANVRQEFPSEVLTAAEHLKKLRDEQVNIGKNSAGMFGIDRNRNLIESDWEAIDHELWRLSTPEQVSAYIHSFNSTEEAEAFLMNYYKAAAKRDVIKMKITRQIEKENKNLPEGAEPRPTEVTAKMVDDYLDEHVPYAVKRMLQTDMHKMEGGEALGELRFLKHRVPIDTSTPMELPSGADFSFDNNLRNFDMDYIVGRNISRFSGEIALKNAFGSQRELDKVMQKVGFELERAASDGKLNKSRVDFEKKLLEDTISELRGKRPQRDALGRWGTLCRILQNASYYKNGANMGFSQLGEIGGVMAYAGARGLFYTFKPLRKLYEDISQGKISAGATRDAEYFLFGDNFERQIWSTNWGDRVVRDALTEDNLINRSLIATADAVKNLGKITSQVNMLGHMTDSMTRGVRNAMIGDSIRWARGEKFSFWRNPFSKAKLEAANVSPRLAAEIKAALNRYVDFNEAGKPVNFRLSEWMNASPNSFWKWRDMIQNQADRALVSGTQMSNRNILKDSNAFWRLIFQYKDYTLRAINSQTMRAMRAKDFDDAMAMGLSMVTNMGAYALKGGAIMAAMHATGAKEKAKEYYDQNFSVEQLGKVAFLRSSMIGSPLSIPNDFYETYTGAPTIRTTVNRNTKRKPSNDFSDAVGDYLTQLPAIKTGVDHVMGTISAFSLATDDTATKRDFRNVLNMIPAPNLIPLTQFINLTVDQSKYPDKKPK